MKVSQRIPKAIAVVIIIGSGLVYNMDKKHVIAGELQQISAKLGKESAESDSIETDAKNTENRLFIYTKTIIETSIHHLIPNI